MITTYAPSVSYIGNGTLATYAFSFKVRQAADILIMVFETDTDLLVFQERGNVLANVTSVAFDALNGGGTITLPANLALDRKLIIKLAVDSPVQDFRFRNQTDFELRQFENGLDQLTAQVQRLNEKISRAFRMSDKATYVDDLNTEIDVLPVPDGIPKFDPTGEFVEFVTPAEIVAAAGAGSGLPVGGALGQVVGHDGTAPIWEDYAFSGFSARFGSLFTSTTLRDTLVQILNITYTGPLISLSGTGSGTIREKGASLASAPLSATVTRRSNNIAAVRFYRGATLIDTQTSGGAIPSGGVSTYTDSTGWTDTVSFSAQADDVAGGGGPTTATSNTVTYSFVYPYYVGAGAAGLSAAAVAGLTKLVISSTSTSNQTITATAGQVFYFAYPASYGALTSILDVSNFETIADWTLRTENITGLDATAQSYRIYEFNNPVVAGSYYYSFRR